MASKTEQRSSSTEIPWARRNRLSLAWDLNWNTHGWLCPLAEVFQSLAAEYSIPHGEGGILRITYSRLGDDSVDDSLTLYSNHVTNLANMESRPSMHRMTERTLIAFNGMQIVSMQPVLQLRCLRRLLMRRVFGFMVRDVLLVCFTVALVMSAGFSFPEKRIASEFAKTAGDEKVLELKIISPLRVVGQLCISWCFVVIVLTRASRDMLRKTIPTFDALVIYVNMVLHETAFSVNRISVLSKEGWLDAWLLLSQMASSAFVFLPIAGVFVNVDALMLTRSVKIFVCCTFLLGMGYSAYDIRYVSLEWSKQEFNFWVDRVDMRTLALSSVLNISVFISKMLVRYLRGFEFSIISTGYRFAVEKDDDQGRCKGCCAHMQAYLSATYNSSPGLESQAPRPVGLPSNAGYLSTDGVEVKDPTVDAINQDTLSCVTPKVAARISL